MADARSLPRVLVVTGTNTGVGKTIATAALAVALRDRGLRVAVAKPTQTGVSSEEPGDLQEVCRLAGAAGLTAWEGVRLRDPLAPASAARTEGRSIPSVGDLARAVAELCGAHDVVLVEGAGGLLVELDSAGGTLADLAVALRYMGIGVGVVVVAAPGLGTLNHTALTVEALRSRSLPLVGVVVGSWPQPPAQPDLAMRENLADLPRVAGAPLLGVLPDGAGALTPADFQVAALDWLAV